MTTTLPDMKSVGADIKNKLALKAPLASPALTGTATAPTAPKGTNNTQIATTAFVTTAISAYETQFQTVLSELITTYGGTVPS